MTETNPTAPLLAEAARAAREVGGVHVPDQAKLAACGRVLSPQATAPIDIHALAAERVQAALHRLLAACRHPELPEYQRASYELEATRRDLSTANAVAYDLEVLGA